jgi:nicotinamide-nucleotide amidase
MHAEIVTIGDELLSGDSKIIDTNSIYITARLREVGIDVPYKTTVVDDRARIAEVLRIAAGRVDVIVMTGGLGPTVDDVTREAVADATGRALVFKQALLDQIAARFKRFNVRMSENNRQQAHVPEGAVVIHNPVGTAPAFIVEADGAVFISLPGVPHEMRHLMAHNVMPYLMDKFDLHGVIKTRVLRVTGMGESKLDARIGDLMKLGNPIVGLAAHGGQIDIRIYATGADDADADAYIAEVEDELRERVGRFIFGVGEDALADALLCRLRERGLSIASVEAGTGRVLASALNGVAGSEGAVLATDTHVDVPLLRAALGKDNAPADLEALACYAAEEIRRAKGAALGLAVVTQPDETDKSPEAGGTAIAAVTQTGSRSRRYGFGGYAHNAPHWVCNHALGMAWLLAADGD